MERNLSPVQDHQPIRLSTRDGSTQAESETGEEIPINPSTAPVVLPARNIASNGPVNHYWELGGPFQAPRAVMRVENENNVNQGQTVAAARSATAFSPQRSQSSSNLPREGASTTESRDDATGQDPAVQASEAKYLKDTVPGTWVLLANGDRRPIYHLHQKIKCKVCDDDWEARFFWSSNSNLIAQCIACRRIQKLQVNEPTVTILKRLKDFLEKWQNDEKTVKPVDVKLGKHKQKTCFLYISS